MAYKSLQLVDELIQSLGSSLPADEVESILNKATAAPLPPPKEDCLELLKKHSSDQNAFSAKYLEVKGKKSDMLGPSIELMARIAEDSRLQKYLRKVPGQHKQTVNGSSKKHLNAAVTTESLPLVKRQLKAVNQELERSQHDLRGDRNEPVPRHNGGLAQIPTFPNWFNCRPHLSKDFVASTPPESRLLTLVNVCVASQEHALLADMVNCLAGVDGKHVVAVLLNDPYAKRTFKFAEGTDPALQEMCMRILMLASNYSIVVRFIQQKNEFHAGRVNNALAAAMDEHVLEYLTFVAQTETQLRAGELRLQKLHFSIQAMTNIMSVLSLITQAINNADAQGGKVLSLLHQNAVKLAGDQNSQFVCLELARSASAPYLKSLDTWLLCGIIEDPFEEFLVEDNHVETEEGFGSMEDCDGYWEKRYMVRRERVPSFLGQHTDKILRTGKYLNVIRQCGKSVKSPQTERAEYSFNGQECEQAIEKAYQFASKTLLEILMTEYDLKGRLKWMKHFFLLEQGDFISQFMDACESELQKPILEVEPSRLESLLGLVLRTTSAVSAMGGYYLEDLHTQLLPCSLPAQMLRILTISDNYNSSSSRISSGADFDEPNLSGMEGFTFQVDVKWPVSLVLNSADLSRYQMVFRHLFFIKHVERLLCRVWSSNKVARSFSKADSPLYRPAFALRQRMLNCVQSLEYYMMYEVIEPNWHLFMDKIKKVTSVDDVLLCHSDFIDQCQRECMLTVSELLFPLRKLLDCCIAFCSFILHVRKYFVEAELGSELTESIEATESGELRGGVSAEGWESFEEKIARHEQDFSTLLHGLLELVSRLERDSSNTKLLNILYMLDFNGYYASQRRPQIERSTSSAISG